MAKVKILLEKPLTIHLSKEKSVSLDAGLQEVDKEVAEHWYIKAHSQPISDEALEVDEAKKALNKLQIELKNSKDQLVEAGEKLAEKDNLIADLQARLDAATKHEQPKEQEKAK